MSRAPGFHSRFRHAAFPAHAETFCLSENRRGLQSSVQLLHHSAHARLASQPDAGDIVAEAKALIADGVKEINFISQDSTYYGLDLRPNHSRAISSPEKFSAATKSLAADATTICTLLRELNSLRAIFGFACFTRIRRIGRTN
jgi:tRNA A37 methylthiotransferase MiaB